MRRLLGITLIGLILSFNLWGDFLDTVYQNAIEAYNHKNYFEAVRYFKEYLSQVDPKSRSVPDVMFFLGQSYEMQQHFTLALEYYQTFIKNYPEHGKIGDVLLAMGKLYLNQGNYQNAQAVFQKISRDYPTTYQAVEAIFFESQSLLAQKKLKKSEEVVKKLLKKYPRNPLARKAAFTQGEAWLDIGAFPQAKKTFQFLLDLNPPPESAAAALYGLGWASYRQGISAANQSDVLAYLKQVFEEFPNTSYAPKSLYLYAEIIRELDRLGAAASKYRQLIDNYPGSENRAEAMFKLALTYQINKQPENAIAVLQNLTEEYTGNRLAPNAYFMMGQNAQKAGDYLTAIEAFTHIINQAADLKGTEAGSSWKSFFRIAGNNFLTSVQHLKDKDFLVDAYFLLAEASEKLGDYDSGLQYYLLGTNLLSPEDKRHIKAHLGRASIYSKKKKWQKARSIYLQLLTDNKETKTGIKLLILIAQTHYQEGSLEEAIKMFNKTVEEYPEHQEVSLAYYWLGRIYFDEEKYEKAILSFNSLIENKERQEILLPEVLYKLGYSYSRRDNTVAAIKVLERLLKNFPSAVETPKAAFLAANVNYRIGNYFAAAEHYKKITELFPREQLAPPAQYRLATIHFKNEKYSAASLEFNQFLLSYPKHKLREKVLFALAFSHFSAKNRKGARDALVGFVNKTSRSALTLEAYYLLSLEAWNAGDLTLAQEYLNEAEIFAAKTPHDFEIKIRQVDYQIDNSIAILSKLSVEKEKYNSEAARVFRANSDVLMNSLKPFSDMLKVTVEMLRKKHLKKLRNLVVDVSLADGF